MHTLVFQIIYHCLNEQYHQNYESVDECLNDVIEAYKIPQTRTNSDQSGDLRTCGEELDYLRIVNFTILIILVLVVVMFLYIQRRNIWKEFLAAFAVLKQLNTFDTVGRPRNLIADNSEKDNNESGLVRGELNEPENQQPVIANQQPLVQTNNQPLILNQEIIPEPEIQGKKYHFKFY